MCVPVSDQEYGRVVVRNSQERRRVVSSMSYDAHVGALDDAQ